MFAAHEAGHGGRTKRGGSGKRGTRNFRFVAQTVSDFRVAVDLLRKLLMTFALRLDLLHKPLLTLALRLNLLRLLLKPPAAFTHLFQIARCAPL